jgi:hypothetical protein
MRSINQLTKYTIMKKLNIFIAALLATIMLSCRHQSHVIIATQNGNSYTKLEYAGSVELNDSQTQIKAISYGGYVNFNRNNDELYAATDRDGKIFYELNGDKVTKLDVTGQNLLAEAVRIIAKAQRGH